MGLTLPAAARTIALAAALWGFAEATLFFIVPDMLLSAVAVAYGARAAARACLYALAGALAGGLIMHQWGALDAPRAWAWVASVPAVDEAMMHGVAEDLQTQGWLAVFMGPPQGIPYKVYAVQAHGADIGLAAFLAVSAPARLMRFALVCALAAGIAKALERRISLRTRLGILAAAWTIFYVWYFAVMAV